MNSIQDWTAYFQELQHDPDYQYELLMIAVGEVIVDRMEALGVSRSELAERLGVKPPRVTQILAGSGNLTLRTLAHVAHALDARVVIEFKDRELGEVALDTLTWPAIAADDQAVRDGHALALAA
ncbi:MAG: helix-turn-helix domain-containing protein [Dehalococcoidia bacterium]|nr:helix-turn-helix domain-containing protein [Dehalococcoidia bacterium]